ncbi:MAG: tRNA (adenosine(37)-N6)-threonylcarbamoyltransferase complex transferase subunit TsaD [Dissulfurimicrobium sp.]|uniref:tRNA (adenosine(37)-N6)-threonylcarbamoyltransferase complex transferase subunit TsaD n=1 Tax=Dissulfurimicrobium sp. TaxID=2022436 RepID=UPI004049A51D
MLSFRNNKDINPRYVLAIETSCDETSAAVIEDGRRILSNLVASQIAIHSKYGGVVPELASRHHLDAIVYVVEKALLNAGMVIGDVDAIAVTQGPGLVGSLVVGFSFAKAVAAARLLPITGVNHIHAHLLSVFLERDAPGFPFIGLIVSGGHTALYLVKDFLSMELLGRTRDDAAGEAFDKVAKMLGLEYPGGPAIGRLAMSGDPCAFSYPRAWLRDAPFDFSFSGLKTAVLTSIKKKMVTGSGQLVADICASFQEAVVDVLVEKAVFALKSYGIKDLVICGGVAANQRLRDKISEAAVSGHFRVFLPSLELCTDNAAMVGLAGYHQLRAGILLTKDADVYSRSFC